MFNKFLELFKKPVTTANEMSETTTLKKSFIYTAIFSGVMAVYSLITGFFAQVIVQKYDYSAKKIVKQFVMDNFDFGKLLSGAITSFLTAAIVVIVMATIMYVISRILKNDNNFSKLLTITVVSYVPFALAIIISLLTSWLYAPIGIFAMFAAIIYGSYTMIFAFRNTLKIENENTLVLLYVGIITGIFIVAYYIMSNYLTELLGGILK